MISAENTQKVKDHLSTISVDGLFNPAGFWKIKKKIFPKNGKALPISKINSEGHLISHPLELKRLYICTYVQRLRHRPIKPGLELIKTLKERLCYKRLELVKLLPNKGWCKNDLSKVLKALKTNKSRDPHLLINEIFKPGVIGTDLQNSLLAMFNRVKAEFEIPEIMQLANIVSIYKGKGSKMDLKNDRGIFIMNIFKSIMMKIIYNEEYDVIEMHMSDSNIGARKHKNIRNHIFVLNGIINEAIKKDKAVDIQILDYRQCFDSMWLEDCINDMFDYGVKSPNLALIYEANKVNKVAVMTPNGLTERKTVERIVMQGEVFGPLECSISVDTFGKECLEKGEHLYSYKGVEVPPLAMIDDLACITNCGIETVKTNAYINAKTNLKKLQFGPDKCHKMHIGKKKVYCPELRIDCWKMNSTDEIKTKSKEKIEMDYFDGSIEMGESAEERYLGDIITHDGSNKKNITARKGKGFGIIEKIMEMLQELSFGPSYFEVANLLRHSLFLSSVLLNSEAWYCLSLADIEHLEAVDQVLLRRILEAPSSTPKVSLYLEMGCLPIRFIIKTRRLMFLHYILNQNENSLILKFFEAQKQNPVKGDWSEQIKSDIKEINLQLTFDEIKILSQESFRLKVRRAIDTAAFKWLMDEKESKSKLKDLKFEKLKMQNYLGNKELETIEKKFLFQIRTRMLDVKSNFKNKHSDLSCPLLCGHREDNQQHILECPILLQNIKDVTTDKINYHDIFSSDISKQIRTLRIMRKLWKKRKNIIEKGWHPTIVPHVI